jgi:uncharacterized protein (UPF0548 family)
MFLPIRPSLLAIDRFLRNSEKLPLSYDPVGIAMSGRHRGDRDEQVVAIGSGPKDFEQARRALLSWKHYDMNWVTVYPQRAGVSVGAVVAVLIRHLGFWSLNGCRLLYTVGGASDDTQRYGFAYGTLTNHAEGGEELFEVFIEPATGQVMYRIKAISWPRAAAARVGYPIVRLLQARFRRDSAAALRRAIHSGGVRLYSRAAGPERIG